VARYPSTVTYALGPGPPSPAVRILLVINVAVWVATLVAPRVVDGLGLQPKAVFESLAVWQLVTYMFLHDPGGFAHLLFNMLALWMFGTDLERTWRTRFFVKYYFVTGIGAGMTMLVLSLVNGQF
jgi:membrane associated rhomboid family serine protease